MGSRAQAEGLAVDMRRTPSALSLEGGGDHHEI